MNKWIAKLQKMNGVVTKRKDPFANVLKTFSPSVNFIFGKSHGLPYGYTTVLYGPPKGGKSVISHMLIGWLHQNDPEAIAIKIDTEYRSAGQLDDNAMMLYGIDPDRLLVMSTNSPSAIFDQIEKDVGAQCAAGAPIKLIVIDSVTGIQGRREQDTESVEKQTIGDHAQTMQIGLKRILPVIRDNDIALVLVTQVRAEMDPLEQKRGNKFKMQASFGLQHMAEYFVAVEANKNAAGRLDLQGKELTNKSVKDLAGKSDEQIAMKIRAKMKANSMGPAGRTGEFTFHFQKGLVNQYEEVFHLAKNYHLVDHEDGSAKWAFKGQEWKSTEHFQKALQDSPELQHSIVEELRRRDMAGETFLGDDEPEDNTEE